MLSISQTQLAALSEASDEAFLDRLTAFIMEEFIVAEPYSDVKGKCRIGIARARELGLLTERGIAAFVSCRWEFGANFESDMNLEAARVLATPGLDPGYQTELLLRTMEVSGVDKTETSEP